MGGSADVVASVLNWNDYEDTSNCLRDLKQISYSEIDITVVDNGSTDNSPDRIAEEFPEIEILRADSNLGFAGGHNLAIRKAKKRQADYVWLLNNDIRIFDPMILHNLVERLEQHSDVGAISPLIMRYPEKDQVWFGSGRTNKKTGSTIHDNTVKTGMTKSNDYLPFAATLFPLEVFNHVGLLPEDYFLYLEDASYCQSLINSGYRVATDFNTRLYHKGSSSSGGKVSRTILYYLSRNRWKFVRQWNNDIPLYFYWVLVQWIFIQIARCVYNQNLDSIFALAEGTYHGWQGKSGQGPYP